MRAREALVAVIRPSFAVVDTRPASFYLGLALADTTLSVGYCLKTDVDCGEIPVEFRNLGIMATETRVLGDSRFDFGLGVI